MDDAIEERVLTEFGEDFDAAMEVLGAYGRAPFHGEVDRVRRAILTLSGGDLSRLRTNTETACADYRDVLLFAEYPPEPGYDAAAEFEKSLNLVIWANFSKGGVEPESWEEVQSAIRLSPEVLDKLGSDGLPTREDLLARARAFVREGNERRR